MWWNIPKILVDLFYFLSSWLSGRARGRARTIMVGPRPYLVYSWRRHCWRVIFSKTVCLTYMARQFSRINISQARISTRLRFDGICKFAVMYASERTFENRPILNEDRQEYMQCLLFYWPVYTTIHAVSCVLLIKAAVGTGLMWLWNRKSVRKIQIISMTFQG